MFETNEFHIMYTVNVSDECVYGILKIFLEMNQELKYDGN